jgi:predicted acyl esterase
MGCRHIRSRCAIVLAASLAAFASCSPSSLRGARAHEVDVPIAMRDGVILRARILRPDGPGPFPTLVYRTPYGAAAALEDDTTFERAVERGYAVVVQDVRGRYRSDGVFRPYEHEGRDGYDTIEWAAQQPWSDGNIGTFGLSYPGAVQWLAALESPPHLKAMVPAMTFSTPQNFFYAWGVWDLSWTYWIWVNIAPGERVRRNLPGPRTDDQARKSWAELESRMQDTLPLVALDEMRDVAPYYLEWLRHPPEDPYWDFAELRGRYGATNAAVLNLSGWHDDNYGPEGAATNFAGLVDARRGETPRTALLIGPWVHGVDATARTRAGEREFGPAAAIDYDAVVLDWMDRHVRGLRTATAIEPPVRYFVMGANRWKTATAWPPPAEQVTFALTPAAPSRPGGLVGTGLVGTVPSANRGDLDTGRSRGLSPDTKRSRGLSPANNRQGTVPSSFVADPDNPVRNIDDSAGAHDYRALTERPDVLTFDSPPLDEDTEVTGPITAALHVSCDCRDADIWARLLDVAPDGTAFNLMSPGLDVLRASYRDLAVGHQPLTPGEIYELRLDKLITSNVFKAGHKIRLQISASFFPNFSRNLHTGESETIADRRQKATIRIHHDPPHRSTLTLPVAAPAHTTNSTKSTTPTNPKDVQR